jgi:uncharacterized protein YjiS (DUF1127 family)
MVRIMTISSIRRALGRYGIADPSLLIETLLEWRRLARQRRALASLDDRALKDIGLSRSDIFVETTKPFWRR